MRQLWEEEALGNVGVDITPGYMHCEATPIKPPPLRRAHHNRIEDMVEWI